MSSSPSVSFDAAVGEVWAAAARRCALAMASAGVTARPRAAARAHRAPGVTVAQFVAVPAGRRCRRTAGPGHPDAARRRARRCPRTLAGKPLAAWDAGVINVYGPTETTDPGGSGAAFTGRGDRTGTATDRPPVWNTRVYVLDAAAPGAVGVTGEFYIAGDRWRAAI